MELTVTVATDGDTTLDFYDMYDAVIQELNTIKVRSTTQLEDEDVEQIGPQGTFGAANRGDGPAGTWRLVINEQAGFADWAASLRLLGRPRPSARPVATPK